MTSQADWKFRADYLKQQARYLRLKAHDFECEASRYDGLAEQAKAMACFDLPPALAVTNGERT